MRILITGSNGLLGQKLVARLRNDPAFTLMATGRGVDRSPEPLGDRYRAVDITEQAAVDGLVDDFRPDVLVHGAAMTNVDACELDPAACDLQNVQATDHLVEAAARVGARFVFLSTDFVFDGEAGPYRESDVPAPLSVYGHSKLKGEELVQRKATAGWAIVRTIIVYGYAPGLSRSNAVLWAKDALCKGAPIRVVDDQWRMPTLAEDLAEGCVLIAGRKAQGIFHISGPDGMSILELVQRVGAAYGTDASIAQRVSTAELGQPAARPPRTGFVLDKARTELGYAPRTFEEGLAELRRQLEEAGEWP